jgi:putative endonuclease
VPSSRQALGGKGEALAARWYEERGYAVVARNWRVAAGEIDLVVRQGREIVFCEVKTRATTRFGTPAEAVTPAKQRRVRRLAATYLATVASPRPSSIRFDVACVLGESVEVITEAF